MKVVKSLFETQMPVVCSIREGGEVNASVEVGAKTAIVSEMGDIAFRVGNRR